MGLTGLSCARYLSAKNLSFKVVDSRDNPPQKEIFEKEFPLIEKQYGAFLEDQFNSNDCLIVSPGVALTDTVITKALAAGASLTSDIELFLQAIHKIDEVSKEGFTEPLLVAITGSNGKSTVTMLVTEMLQSAGKKVCVAGNIGLPVLDQLLIGSNPDVYVLELSSFQLERLPNLAATVATILNVTEDHMDRYSSFTEYLAAKQQIFIAARHVVINRDDILTDAGINRGMISLSYGLSTPLSNNFGLEEYDGVEWIVFGEQKIITTASIKIKGRHNIANAMAALAIGKTLNIDWQPMIETLTIFKGLRHRCEWVAELNGVNFYNDSKATNVGATVAAIKGFSGKNTKGNLILIAGGLDKDSDFSPMADVVRENVEKVFLIGKDAKKIELAIGSEFCCLSDDLPSAVNDANKLARKGDVVLFAPACASFDMFKNYEERGDAFVDAVRALVNE